MIELNLILLKMNKLMFYLFQIQLFRKQNHDVYLWRLF